MTNKVMRSQIFLILLTLTGCAGLDRSCSGCLAQAAGADWIVAAYSATGKPYLCWVLRDVSVANEPQSDGIYWLDQGGLIHAPTVFRVQVSNGDFKTAAQKLGVDFSRCVGGRYMETEQPIKHDLKTRKVEVNGHVIESQFDGETPIKLFLDGKEIDMTSAVGKAALEHLL